MNLLAVNGEDGETVNGEVVKGETLNGEAVKGQVVKGQEKRAQATPALKLKGVLEAVSQKKALQFPWENTTHSLHIHQKEFR